MVDPVEELLQVHVHHDPPPSLHVRCAVNDRVVRTAPRPKAVAVLAEGRIQNRLQHLQQRLLDQPVRAPSGCPARARLRPLSESSLLLHRLGPVRPLEQLLADHGPVRRQVSGGLIDRPSRRRRERPCLPVPASTPACRFSRVNAASSSADPVRSVSCVAVGSFVAPRYRGLHRALLRGAPFARTSDALSCHIDMTLTLLLVRPFAARLAGTTTTASADFSLRFRRRPFRREARSPQVRTRSFTAQPPDLRRLSLDHKSFAVSLPARPARHRLISGSCPSARGFAPRFLPTLGRPHAVALRFVRCGQLTGGLPPPRSRPCWAHTKKSRRHH